MRMHVHMHMHARMHAHARARARVRVYVCARARVRLHVPVCLQVAKGNQAAYPSSKMKPAWARRSKGPETSMAEPSKPAWARRGVQKKAKAPRPAMERAWTPDGFRRALRASLLPKWWVALILACIPLAMDLPLLAGVEYFSGEAELAKACEKGIGPWGTYDIKNGQQFDCTTKVGQRCAIVLLLRLARHSHAHFGTPCRSWVALSRSFTKRSGLRPGGPPKSRCTPALWKYLSLHNQIAQVTSYLIKTCVAMGHTITIEQPVSSLLFSYEPMVAALVGTSSVSVAMRAFRGDSPKPLKIVGNAQWLGLLRKVFLLRKRGGHGDGVAKRLTERSAKGQFGGKKGELEASSAYTASFGFAFALCVQRLPAAHVVEEMRRRGL